MDATQVIADLTAQIDWYGKLLRLTELQHTLVEQERTDDLLVVLDKRQTIVEAVTTIEQRLRPIKLGWQDESASLPAEHRLQIEERFATVRGLLQQITQADQDDALLLQQRKINVGQQLRRTGAGQTLNRNYAAASAYGKSVGGRLNISK